MSERGVVAGGLGGSSTIVLGSIPNDEAAVAAYGRERPGRIDVDDGAAVGAVLHLPSRVDLVGGRDDEIGRLDLGKRRHDKW